MVDWDKREAWLEPNDTLFDEDNPDDARLLKMAQEMCSSWGRRAFSNETNLRNMLHNLGEEAFENSWESCETDFWNHSHTSLSEQISEASSHVSEACERGSDAADLER